MASLEYIDFKPWREAASGNSCLWEPDSLGRPIGHLPQLFWKDGTGWGEVNVWALERAADGSDLETVRSDLKHLLAYANYLEISNQSWLHFPVRKSERTVFKFRGDLVCRLREGLLASSTAAARMSAVIKFYRYCSSNKFIAADDDFLREKAGIVQLIDCNGFERTISVKSTDLVIRNSKRRGIFLEEGLLPLSERHMVQLLAFTLQEDTAELNLMLTMGFFTGARFETISSLKVKNIEEACEDPLAPGMFLVRIGPGTGVATKFNVSGDLLVPNFLLDSLRQYAYSTERLMRQSKASPSVKSILFLTKHGNAYAEKSISKLMSVLRRKCVRAGLKYMQKFKFHQTRATFGTWFLKIILSRVSPSVALEVLKCVMLHKDEATTFRYIKFIDASAGKIQIASAFNEAFTGLKNRDWNDFNA